jgi:3-hydroxybutyryl-CoA dehydrogenase
MRAADVTRVAVIGAGTMGAGIAGLFARAGCAVRLVDQNSDFLERGMTSLRAAQEGLRAARMVSARKAAAALKRVRPLTSLAEACPGAELVIEAITEDLKLKQQTFRDLDELCPASAVFASNTSGLSITAIGRALAEPGRLAGMHFWNPPHLIPLVEIVKGKQTTESTAEFLLEMCRRLGKRPILVRRDIPGFVGNRLQFAVLREALHLLAAGVASAQDIDAAMTAGPGLRYGLLGPLRTADLGGLDVFLAISRYLFADLNSEHQPPAVLSELVKRGRLGAKAGGGFYDYSARELPGLLAERDRILIGFLRVLEQKKG